jgi:hypothetical protein
MELSSSSIESCSSENMQGNPSRRDECDGSSKSNDNLEVAHDVFGLLVIFFICIVGVSVSLWVIYYTQRYG